MKIKKVEAFLSEFDKEELIWIKGYISGFVAGIQTVNESDQPVAMQQYLKKITLIYGTETGNAKKLAFELATLSKKKNIPIKLVSIDQYRLIDLDKEEHLFIVISTHGEGEPPSAAKKFYDHIHSQELSLKTLNYGVLALGDSSYPLFCQTGMDIDAQLEKLGGNRIIPLQKCDVDYNADSSEWFGKVFNWLEQKKTSSVQVLQKAEKKPITKEYYDGEVVRNINLNDKGSNKETHHIEIAVRGRVEYEPGDSLAIIPQNKKEVIDHILRCSGVEKNLIIETEKRKATIERLLRDQLNICYLLTSTVKKYATITGQNIPDTRMDLIDLLRIYPIKELSQFVEVIKILNPIAPRLYSISSSPSAHADEVHVTVGKKSFSVQDEPRFGLCSEFLASLPEGTHVKFYIHKNRAFKLPRADKNIIMIGPGTGIAPFRSFLSEREAANALGKNWLFFGEQHFVSDFLYQTEIQNYLQTGILNKISLAFSRDGKEKTYVQHRMAEEKNELSKWIEAGAYLFVSGSKAMGTDVEKELIQIIGAPEFKKLKEEGRYQKDVY